MQNQQFSFSRLTPLFEYLNKQREDEKNSKIIELTITFTLISFFLFFAIRPTLFTISTLVGDIKSKEILVIKMKTKIDQIITAQDNFSSVQEKYNLVEEALPQKQKFVDVYNKLDTITTQNNIILDKINFNQSEDNFFTTQVSTSSSYSSIMNIISSLSKSRRLVDIPSITLNQETNTQTKSQINFVIPVNIYFWNNQDEKK